jgi:hypothetical protein
MVAGTRYPPCGVAHFGVDWRARTDRGFWRHAFLAGGGLWRIRVHGGRGATLPFVGVAAAAEAQPAVHDLAGQVQDRGVVVQDEVGVGGQDDPVQFEGEPVGVLPGRKFVLGDGGGRGAGPRTRPGRQRRFP